MINKVVIIAIKEFDNLGIGYLAAVLKKEGYNTVIAIYNNDKDEIIRILREEKPVLVGFSVIYQYHIDKFADLIKLLRQNGINVHFTAGGHYASLKYRDLFGFADTLDSIVRFEGEYTFLELVKCIASGIDWKQIKGIAYRSGKEIITNPVRPFEKDLDAFPYPLRAPLKEYAFGKKFASIIAGRGCIFNCSFCNLREFYRQSGGPLRRIRQPHHVVEEMKYLNHAKDCAIFLFEDDDFPVRTSGGSDWIVRFCKEIARQGLKNKILWKINCRSDEIEEDLFTLMKDHGLYMVFIGVDDGTDIGLKKLNKHITVAGNLSGINTLKKLGIGFDYGFMLFQPMTTFRTLRENLDFLERLCSDGYNTVMFNKLRPYYLTGIERELILTGRMKGDPGYYDYDFIEEPMNDYYNYTVDCYMEWLRGKEGVVNLSRWLRIFSLVFSRYYNVTPEVVDLQRNITDTIAESNQFILDSMKEISVLFESGRYLKSKTRLAGFRKTINLMHTRYKQQIVDNLCKFIEIHKRQFEPLLKLEPGK